MIGKEKAYEIVDKYLMEYVGNLVASGEPVFDSKVDVWVVPIFHKSKVATFPLSEVILDAEGNFVYVPAADQLEEIWNRKFSHKIKLKT